MSLTNSNNKSEHKTALILSGGGARAAYQVGVLKAIAEIVPEGNANPFPIICGTSAGSINTVALASNADNFHLGVKKIINVWSNFQLNHVFHVDSKYLFGRILWWGWSHLGFGKWYKGPGSLLNNQPLRTLLNEHISFKRIDKSIKNGDLHAYCLTACSYTSGESTTFFDGNSNIKEWVRTDRQGKRKKMRIDHMIASSAIPVVFESVKIGNEYYGDGSMRQISPISPAIHLGANKILIIGLRREDKTSKVESPECQPSLGQISGYILDTLFLNSLQSDVARMERMNKLLKLADKKNDKLKVVEHLLINPSKDIADIAIKHYKKLPLGFRIALTFLGINKGNSRRFVSYLMFTEKFCQELITLGYEDAMKRKDDLHQFLKS